MAPQPPSYHTVYPLDGFPDLLTLHQHDPVRYPHLLESVVHGTTSARYDILFAFAQDRLQLTAQYTLELNHQVLAGNSFLDALEQLWQAQQPTADDVPTSVTPPFRGGWFVFMSYELATEIESRLLRLDSPETMPIAMATRFPTAIIRDHKLGSAYIVSEDSSSEDLVAQIRADLAAMRSMEVEQLFVHELSEEDPQIYLDNIQQVQHYIREGDVFQVNLSRLWHATLDRAVPAGAIYQRLRQSNPAPFAGLMSLENGTAVISSSPERLLKVQGNRIITRPIAGTYPRGQDAQRDAELRHALIQHPKERAEHIMLLDLERNDLGRVCVPGSVAVSELMTVESYAHVHHIVSEVSGTLRQDIRPTQALRAVFPGGTITGCPKVRCMQIISELEQAPRGAYTGSMGYLNHDGSLDMNILIRTLVQNGKQLSLRAGGGIVADSQAEKELHETRAKAKGILAALRAA